MVTFLLVLAVIALAWVTIGYVTMLIHMMNMIEDQFDGEFGVKEKMFIIVGVMFAWPTCHLEGAKYINNERTKNYLADTLTEIEEEE